MCFSLQLNLFLTALQSLPPINQLVANLISSSGLQQKVFLIWVWDMPGQVQTCLDDYWGQASLPGGFAFLGREEQGSLLWIWQSLSLSKLEQVTCSFWAEFFSCKIKSWIWSSPRSIFNSGHWNVPYCFLCCFYVWYLKEAPQSTQTTHHYWSLWEPEFLLWVEAVSESHLSVLWQLV